MRATTKFAAMLLFAVSADAQAQGVSWAQLPSASETEAAYPITAKQQGIGGHVWLGCELKLDGVLSGCGVAAETPEGLGFGKAALQLVPRMRAAPRTSGPRSSPVTLPVHFGPPTPERPVREASFKTSDGRFSIDQPRFRRLAPIGPYWPDYALRTGMAGKASIDCKVLATGALAECSMVGERTSHPMFGHATLAMARRGWMTAGSAPVGVEPPPDGLWRFTVDYPARTLADVR